MLATGFHQYYEGGRINYNSIKTRKINKIKRKPTNSFFLRDIWQKKTVYGFSLVFFSFCVFF